MAAVEVATAAAAVVINGEHTKCASEVFPQEIPRELTVSMEHANEMFTP